MLLAESRWESLFRWVRIVLRSAPMALFIVGVPLLLVVYVLPGAGASCGSGAVTGFVCAVLVLQVRACVCACRCACARTAKRPRCGILLVFARV